MNTPISIYTVEVSSVFSGVEVRILGGLFIDKESAEKWIASRASDKAGTQYTIKEFSDKVTMHGRLTLVGVSNDNIKM